MPRRFESRHGAAARTITPTPGAVKDQADAHGATRGNMGKRAACTAGAVAAGTGLLLWRRSRAKAG
ncbi:hypothetical protein [Yinghuangia seranimata]|uniref:hypothetical protein n=1 Tax=Yinghuangia seranimata TaxID=408067 RepID=UPI00248C1526|nr:hypothetical protein [Yinghuangia seranimata]MDI2125493.1 hypothetical protein [Yinghuangia seranimata]